MSELPDSWVRAPIRDIAFTSSGGTPSRGKPEYFGGSIPWVKSGELNDGLVRSTEETITEEGLKNSSAKIFPAGTVCIALYGATVGKTAVLAIDASTNQAVCGIQPKDGISRNYLLYFLQSQRAKLVSLSQGGAQPNISQELVRGTEIPVAPSAEQDRIVAEIEKQFTRLDAATTALKRVQANLKRYRASVLKAACEGRLVPTEAELARKEGRDYEPADQLLQRILRERRARWEADTLAKMIASGKPPKDDRWKQKYKEPAQPNIADLPPLPEGWRWASWEQLSLRVTVGHVGPMKHRYSQDGIPFLRSQNVRANRFDEEGLLFIPRDFHRELEKSALAPGDLLVVRSGSVGTTCVLPDFLPEANCADMVIIQKPYVTPDFGAYYMNSQAQALIAAGKVGVALIHFNTASVANLPVPLPPAAEQSRIVAEAARRLSTVDSIERSILRQAAHSQRLRQTVLASAFSGKLVSQDSSDEPASVLLERIRAERASKPKVSARTKREEPAYA